MITVMIAGHLGVDPEQRVTPSGLKVWNLRVATNVRKGGEDKTVWWKVTIWGDRWDKVLGFLKKGSAIIIHGRMNPPEIYTDRNGNQQVSLEVVAEMVNLSPFGRSGQSNEAQSSGESAQEPSFQPSGAFQGVTSGAGQANFAADDIPF